MKSNITTLLLPILILGTTTATRAATIAAEFTSAPTSVGHSGQNGNSATTLGWTFTTNNDLFVTALGYYDDGSNGLSEPHDVGIFASNGTLLVSATVPSGTIASLVDSFRYFSITPFTLASGNTYTIGATIGALASDPAAYDVAGLVSDPAITIPSAAARYTEAGSYTSLTYPTINFASYNLYGGPNFQLQSTPEPSSILLLSTGVAGLLSIARRRKPREESPNERNG